VKSQDLERLRNLLRREKMTVLVETVPDGRPHWQVADGWLVNSQSDFFSIGAVIESSSAPRFVLRQVEKALIMLLVTRSEAGVFLLLSVRSEPGLIGLTCFSTTIQSTQSNYMRKHGGKATPYINHARDPSAERILHDSFQYDWGDLYEGKSKHFLVLEVEQDLHVDTGFVWVSLSHAKQMLLEDDLITNDLRACLALIASDLEPKAGRKQGNAPHLRHALDHPSRSSEGHPSRTYQDMDELQVTTGDGVSYQDGFGNAVLFLRTTARSREVPIWTQPLLRLLSDRRITLYASAGDEQQYALCLASQAGPPSIALWTPADPVNPHPGMRRVVLTSGEGGRFFRYRIALELITVEAQDMHSLTWPEGTVFMAGDDVQCLVAQSLVTTLELRLVWSLVAASRG